MAISAKLLIVAGGGGGGANVGGGGGGGGVVENLTHTLISGQSVSITVGSGGAAATNGSASSAFGYTAVGGGAGRNNGVNGNSGGSGGGGGGATGATTGGSGTVGQGYDGGTGQAVAVSAGGGGGGGGAGSNAGTGAAGAGGIGYLSSVSGSAVRYAGGGGGGGYIGIPGGAGGSGGGANGGGNGANVSGSAATDNTGGGGGGCSGGGSGVGGAGGSGIVIVAYQTSAVTAIGSGGTITTSGGYTIHTFTSSGTFVSPTLAVATITGLAVASTTEESATLTWTAASAPTSKVLIYRHTSNSFGAATLCGAVDVGTSTLTVGGLASSTPYYFWAVGMAAGGETGTESASATGTTAAEDAGFVTPGTPTSLAVSGPTQGTLGLAWTDGANTSWVHVYQSTTNNSATATLAEVAAGGAQAVTVYGLDPSTTYYFWLKAVSSSGRTSAFSTGASGTTTAASVPAAPTLTRTA